MTERISSLILHHDIPTLLIAVLICTAGSLLFVQLLGRARRTDGVQRLIWTFYAGLIGGGTVWTTHFIAILAWRQDLLLGFDPILTASSLIIAVVVTALGAHIVAIAGESRWVEFGGAVIGLGIASMHYLGMAGLNLCAELTLQPGWIAFSILSAITFGSITANRIARPITQFCRFGGALSFALAILLLHLAGIGGLDLAIDWALLATVEPFSPYLMIEVIIAVMALILLTTGGAYLNDSRHNEETNRRYRHMAMHDSLTGLPNRPQIRDHLDATLKKVEHEDSWVAVLSLDLDRFKEINDVHGHTAGDEVLRVIADRLGNLQNENIMIGRFGGDEFLAVVGPVWRKAIVSYTAEKILAETRKPVPWKGHQLSVGVSIGVARYPEDGQTSDQLLDRADLAMYEAKDKGKNRIERYQQGMEETNRSRSALAMDLQNAIENDEFEIHYQLQNDTVSEKVVGAEALLRWRHPVRGMVPPSEFIPISEDSGLITKIGEMVLRRACKDAAGWPNPIRLAVNVAPKQLLSGDFIRTVHEALLDSGLAPERLELEITEGSIIADQQHALHIIRQLKGFGVRIAMDDYGTGYSSLSTLHNFPFDKIKIDRSFISDLPTNDHSAAIVRATLILGKALNIPILAEGVETEEHIDFLRGEGCEELQGFFFGKPMGLTQLNKRLGAKEEAVSPADDEATDRSDIEAPPIRGVA
ncbi:bifunctional diguanylate cyclase/phosphodiesterase [Notoacmeibacter sp. MSK16QG-6]|uniref:putative bifunctional diguanylate cyclase/phosphodiesterase n=1 Tax=Notoacmeibacter sp. MSK16QG-6 TaxID=2957982 RepID=UPI0020A19AA2|nr:EAL domain-containing protein [Notoacmeibacter sp. MSK16QG-6]MCP1198839.1 EAL domain-containing protein [Notoacmeibacter sp. MSK16QG-6]